MEQANIQLCAYSSAAGMNSISAPKDCRAAVLHLAMDISSKHD